MFELAIDIIVLVVTFLSVVSGALCLGDFWKVKLKLWPLSECTPAEAARLLTILTLSLGVAHFFTMIEWGLTDGIAAMGLEFFVLIGYVNVGFGVILTCIHVGFYLLRIADVHEWPKRQ